MTTLLKRVWNEDHGVLTFEWVLLITIVILGIVGGLSAARDAIIDELGDVAGAAVSIDQSYTVTRDKCLEIGNQRSATRISARRTPACRFPTPKRRTHEDKRNV